MWGSPPTYVCHSAAGPQDRATCLLLWQDCTLRSETHQIYQLHQVCSVPRLMSPQDCEHDHLRSVQHSASHKLHAQVSSLGAGKFGWPAVLFNLAGGLLIQKRRAEKALEESSMSYAIVRPGGMERPGMEIISSSSCLRAALDRQHIPQLSMTLRCSAWHDPATAAAWWR